MARQAIITFPHWGGRKQRDPKGVGQAFIIFQGRRWQFTTDATTPVMVRISPRNLPSLTTSIICRHLCMHAWLLQCALQVDAHPFEGNGAAWWNACFLFWCCCSSMPIPLQVDPGPWIRMTIPMTRATFLTRVQFDAQNMMRP